jgi:hypothetical protein
MCRCDGLRIVLFQGPSTEREGPLERMLTTFNGKGSPSVDGRPALWGGPLLHCEFLQASQRTESLEGPQWITHSLLQAFPSSAYIREMPIWGLLPCLRESPVRNVQLMPHRYSLRLTETYISVRRHSVCY